VVKLDSPSAPALRFSICAEHIQWVFLSKAGIVFAEAPGQRILNVPGEKWANAAVAFAARTRMEATTGWVARRAWKRHYGQ
jgi:hypothetical protein